MRNIFSHYSLFSPLIHQPHKRGLFCKILNHRHPNGPSHKTKVWVEPFQRLARVEGAKPSSPPQRRKIILAISIRAANYWFFLCGCLLKERTERFFAMLRVLIHSVLFLGYVAARKSTKKNGGYRGAAPNPATFLKKGRSKTLKSGGILGISESACRWERCRPRR